MSNQVVIQDRQTCREILASLFGSTVTWTRGFRSNEKMQGKHLYQRSLTAAPLRGSPLSTSVPCVCLHSQSPQKSAPQETEGDPSGTSSPLHAPGRGDCLSSVPADPGELGTLSPEIRLLRRELSCLPKKSETCHLFLWAPSFISSVIIASSQFPGLLSKFPFTSPQQYWFSYLQ